MHGVGPGQRDERLGQLAHDANGAAAINLECLLVQVPTTFLLRLPHNHASMSLYSSLWNVKGDVAETGVPANEKPFEV